MTRSALVLRLSIATILLGSASATLAQPAVSVKEGASEALQEVVITGSMIKRTSADTTEAVTVISTETLKTLGVVTLEQALSQISANQMGVTAQTSISAFGTGGGTYASLRALGANKTLVLLDGQRLANNAATGAAVDLNTIPFSAIERIEVLREGASALYGSDAIAGVINFITKKSYEGGEFNLGYAHPQQAGAGDSSFDATWGQGNLAKDGYSFLVSGSYAETRELTAAQRPKLNGINPANGLLMQNGQYGPFPGAYFDAVGNYFNTGYPTCAGNPALTTANGRCDFAYAEATDLLPKTKIYSGLVSFNKSLPGNHTFKAQYFYAHSDNQAYAGPITYVFNVTPQSPYYPTAANSQCWPAVAGCAAPVLTGDITAGWTPPDNSRVSANVNEEQRILLGLTGANSGWDYNLNFNYSQNKNTFELRNGYAQYYADPTGAISGPVLANSNNEVSDLVNPFGPQSAAGAAFINSTYRNGAIGVGKMTLGSFNGGISHGLGDLFGSGHASTLAAGFDMRWEKINYSPTALTAPMQAATAYAPFTIADSRKSQALFVELNLPILSNFEATLSDREDHFSDFGSTNRAKLALRYQPLTSLTLRGSVSTGFRAANLYELYSPQNLGATAGNMTGPGCPNAGNPSAIFTVGNCTSQGVQLYGGNPHLRPETSVNYNLGAVYTPIDDLAFTVDYYNITVKNLIGSIPSQSVYANPTEFADLYHLNSAGSLTQAPLIASACPNPQAPTCGYILQFLQNTGTTKTSGVDLTGSYVLRTEAGNFRFGLEGTVITQYDSQQYQGGPILNLVGQFNQGNQPAIRWKHMATADWSRGDWGAGLSNNFIDGYKDYAAVAAPPLNDGNIHSVGNYSIWSGYGSWKPMPSLTLVLGVKNLLNTDPPFSNYTGSFQGSYNPLWSDPIGREYYGRVKYSF